MHIYQHNSVFSAGFCGMALEPYAQYYHFIYAKKANYGEDVDCLVMLCPISISGVSPQRHEICHLFFPDCSLSLLQQFFCPHLLANGLRACTQNTTALPHYLSQDAFGTRYCFLCPFIGTCVSCCGYPHPSYFWTLVTFDIQVQTGVGGHILPEWFGSKSHCKKVLIILITFILW